MPDNQDIGPLDAVAAHLQIMGYDLTPYGAGVALLEIESGYNSVEVASHIALTTLALDIKEAGNNIITLIFYVPHARALLRVLKDYMNKGMMHPTQWQNDANVILRISTVDAHQEEWIETVLSDPVTGKARLANSRIDYSGALAE